MWRTYKSKKDAGGGLDHRDMLLNMDEKSSVFDAFYISNIKQTKREQSCMGSSNNYGAASNRVRKRKYVKRLVKEVTPPPKDSLSDSVSGSVFLTPDKSIHVNKAPDLFDQLLNSSPAFLEVKQAKKEDMFDKIREKTPKKTKTYNRRKKPIKKFNYSSIDSSASEKENVTTNNDSSMNGTNINAHELVIEKELVPCPIDESINNIVKKLSLINNKNSTQLLKKTFKCNKNRLTKNLPSPIGKNSPLSSTPFMDKTRNKSIYKFSPIPIGDLDGSPNYVSIVEDDNDINKSVIFTLKTDLKSQKRSQQEQPSLTTSNGKENSKSLFSSKSGSEENVSMREELLDDNSQSQPVNEHSYCTNASSLQISETQPFLGFSNETIAKVEKVLIEEGKDDSIILSLSTGKLTKSISKKNLSSEVEVKNNPADESVKSHADESVIEYSVPPEPLLGFTQQDDSIISISAPESSMSSQPFLGFSVVETKNNDTCNNDDESQDTESDQEQNNSVINMSIEEREITVNNNDFVNESNAKNGISQNEDTFGDDSNLTSCSQVEDTLHDEDYSLDNSANTASLDSLTEDDIPHCSHTSEENKAGRQTLYDTCCSDIAVDEENKAKELVVSIEKMDIELLKKYHNNVPLHSEKRGVAKPVVALERMSIDLFKKYYEEMPNYIEGDEIDLEELSGEYASLDNTNEIIKEEDDECSSSLDNTNESIDKEDDECSQSTETERDVFSVSSDSCGQETTSSGHTEKSAEQEQCISFVTTRRRNTHVYANDSTILVLNDSYGSTSSECDKTVLSSNKLSLISSAQNVNKTVVDTNTENFLEKTLIATETGKTESPDSKKCNITTRNSRISKPRDVDNSLDSLKEPDIKPGIILQPGKKWERSLSIYRRMTMADHCDLSLLEDEDMHYKGRKYRQSVIHTMEMQDKSLIHNESIYNRRSTFVSKPSRSTIRIVKETNDSLSSLCSTTVYDDLKGFLEDCDDTIVELSKLSLIDEHDVTVIEKFHEASRIAHETSRVSTARDYVLRRCNQSDTIPFDECYPDPLLKNCRKIGEGVYGEVFLWRAPDGLARVMKVVPIAGHVKVNGEQQKNFHEIIAEIVIAMELSALRAPIAQIESHLNEGKHVDELDLHAVENATDVFNEVLAVRCVYGSYPSRLLDLWELYDETKGSENDNPAVLPRDQQYIVLELANAGEDLESYQFNSAEQAHALFVQVAFGLAVGEEQFQFEHRDLHWGNVLIAPTDQKYATFVLRGRAHRVPRRGVAATIIDYSLSRLSLPLGTRERFDTAALYNDLAADEGLFGAVGDYQFEVYRLMKDKLGNDWKNFEPYTNILWLHYTVDKMITALRYKRTNTKTHKQYINKLKAIKERILTYGSAVQFVLTDNEF